MSPAQRKSAKARRSATRTARASSTRGKPRGLALAKAMKVKGKTPAKRGSHSKARKVNGSGAGCDMPREELELLLDREGGREAALTHVPGCHPCTTSLTVIASQRDSVRHLVAEPGGTAVELLLERGARAGERKLADLVYELAKACLVVVQDIDRRLHLETRPRTRHDIEREVRGAALRVAQDARRTVASKLETGHNAEPNAVTAAISCIGILEQLEGTSERQRLAQSVVLICSARPSDAEQLLTKLLGGNASTTARLHACRNLQWALNRQSKYLEAIQHGQAARAEFPADWQLTYNFAVSCAWAQKRDQFVQAAKALRRLKTSRPEDTTFRNGVLRFEATRFAEALGMSRDAVWRLFAPSHEEAASIR